MRCFIAEGNLGGNFCNIMELLRKMGADLVLLGLKAEDKWEIISHMVDCLVASESFPKDLELDRDAILDAVIEREKDHSTGLGNGIAFPHARIPGFPGICLCVAILNEPVDFNGADQLPVDIICLMVVSEDQPQLALKVMAQFARMIMDPVNLSFLRHEDDRRLLASFIAKRVMKFDDAITAGDIMRAPMVEIHPDTPLKEVTRLMFHKNLDTTSVVEEDGTLVGEIISENLFKIGMPDFFSQLKSVAFISEFDPFEKYFESERKTLARDVMSQDFSALPESATLLEVVFELAVKRHSKVWVVEEGRRIGVIDRMLVLDRVINI